MGCRDINYNVIRWEASPYFNSRLGFGPSLSDPRTGEILAADILLNFTGVARRYGHWFAIADYEWLDQPASIDNVAVKYQPSTAHAYIERTANNQLPKWGVTKIGSQKDRDGQVLSGHNKILATQFPQKFSQKDFLSFIKFSDIVAGATGRQKNTLQNEEKIRSLLLGAGDQRKSIAASLSEDAKVNAAEEEPASARMIRELITDLTMHEVGHTLGLTHNFAGSRYRSNEDIHDISITNGLLSGSVMDYLPINFAPPGRPQGNFANTRIGPYDIWAIKFGYGDDKLNRNDSTRSELLQQAGTPGYEYLEFGGGGRTLAFDLSDNPIAYALDRIHLANSLIADSEKWSIRENTQSNVEIFSRILGLRSQALRTILAQLEPIGMQVDDRFERRDRNRLIKSFTPKAEQLAALDALEKELFTVENWSVPEELNLRLGEFAVAPITLDGGRFRFSNRAINSLLNPYFLLRIQSAQEQGGDGLSLPAYLKRVREIVIGNDLGPTGRPSRARQAQHHLYLTSVLLLTNYVELDIGSSNLTQIALRRHLQKEIDILKRDLLFPYFWLPEDIKIHREELRKALP